MEEQSSNSSCGIDFLRRHIREVEELKEASKNNDLYGELSRVHIEFY